MWLQRHRIKKQINNLYGREFGNSILEEVAELYAGKIYVYTLDAEKEPELAALFGVRSYPTVIFCPMEGAPRIAQGYRELDFWKEGIKQYFGL